ncbi:hypothetical protein CkaCkLH20_03491 [Colletotrichum karsti]|uniref:Uncharacterized protein n=1 Tax=Colletotrichum karsti TaxID=1095194 RepID=A0A9P6IAD6_9PEZI|nr:uncharacterized protein CkaCkLH20_03491 [Colletotrichum karsti]KAF9879258.1 hypothetical protein CkaCkLH20_03491 [Colletotrichum karsti]
MTNMNFGKFTDVAKQLSGQKDASKDNQKEGASSQTSDQQGWDKVGDDAKKAFANYQAGQAQGKDPNYTEIGGVAQAAFSAYNRGSGAEGAVGDGQDKEDIGKKVVAGLDSATGTGEEGLKTDDEVKLSQGEEGTQTLEKLQGLGGEAETEGEGGLYGESKRTTRSQGLKGETTFSAGYPELQTSADVQSSAEIKRRLREARERDSKIDSTGETQKDTDCLGKPSDCSSGCDKTNSREE